MGSYAYLIFGTKADATATPLLKGTFTLMLFVVAAGTDCMGFSGDKSLTFKISLLFSPKASDVDITVWLSIWDRGAMKTYSFSEGW